MANRISVRITRTLLGSTGVLIDSRICELFYEIPTSVSSFGRCAPRPFLSLLISYYNTSWFVLEKRFTG